MTTIRVGNYGVKLSMWDTPGQGDYDRFRPLAYSSADMFLVCVAVNDNDSFKNAFDKWIKEIDLHSPETPKLIVGTKSDKRINGSLNPRRKDRLIPYCTIENSAISQGY